MARVAIVLLGVALAAAVTASGAAAEDELNLYLTGPHGQAHRNTLGLRIFPDRGVAVVFTSESDVETENDRGVAYATRTRKGLHSGRIDVHFPGLGRIVGRVVGDGASESRGSGNPCGGSGQGGESGHFVGHLVFRGAGGYRTWRATHAEAQTTPCGAADALGGPAPKTLFGYISEYGPLFYGGGNGPTSVLAAGRGSDKRTVELIAEIHGRGPEETAEFTAFDREWLAGGRVAANRWADRRGMPLGNLFEIAPGARQPPSATLRPPAPFSGEATYSRKGHTLTGDLSVDLLGLKLRIAGAHTVAFLDNSE